MDKKQRALSIVGAKHRNGGREINDHYPTPPFVVERLLEREQFIGTVWEPACGEGNISKVLMSKGFEVYSSDLVNRGFGHTEDFLKAVYQADNLITNPPFSLALPFVLRAKQQTSNKIALFLKTVFLESESRYAMFQDKIFPLKTVYQFSRRVTLYRSGMVMKNKGMQQYAWFIWERGYAGLPTIQWIL